MFELLHVIAIIATVSVSYYFGYENGKKKAEDKMKENAETVLGGLMETLGNITPTKEK